MGEMLFLKYGSCSNTKRDICWQWLATRAHHPPVQLIEGDGLPQLMKGKPEQNGQYFADNISKYIVLNKNVILLRFIPKGPIVISEHCYM